MAVTNALCRGGLGRMTLTSAAHLAVVVFAGLCRFVVAFNVDVHVPIVKEGISGSYFGYSIAQHYVFNSRLGFGDPYVLVGAPRDNITDRSAPPNVRSLVRPGSVYKCPFSSNVNDCTVLKIDRESPPHGVDRNDQWFGVSVVSQGTDSGRALACAHRYKKSGPSYLWGLGVCISMTNALDEDQFWEPCEGDLPKSKGHGEYGLCQAGTSAALDKDGDLLLGAPGPYNWRGAVFKNSINQSINLDGENESWLHSPVEDLLPGDKGKPEPAIGFYSYLGMSVKIGRLLNGNKKTYVVGAPRSKESGQVLLMQAVESGLVVRQYLSGEQFGSSFGYDMAIVDVNNDKREDLIVGAPFFNSAGVGGAIYVFLNGPSGIEASRNQTILGRKLKEVECVQLDCHNARFGFALASPGDIDSDGYNDVIVGAPYEGSGAIYIFRGSARGLVVDYSQRIHSSDLPSSIRPVRSFGHALSAGMDMDLNGYPDVVVGSFGSDRIVILRSRPVINVVSTLVSTPPKINLHQSGEQQCRDRSINSTYCFEVEACFQFSAKPVERFRGPIYVAYKIEAEKFATARPPRVTFKGAVNREDGSYVDLEITLRRQGQNECRRLTVFINNNNRDFLNPIKLKLTQRLRNQAPPAMVPGGVLPDINLNPILNASLVENHLTVDFLKNCGRDGECVSNLGVKGTLELPMDNVTKDYVLRVGQVRELKLVITVTNAGEEAHEAMVYVDMPPSLEYRGTDDRGRQYSCTPGENNTVICAVGNPMVYNQDAKFTIRLDPGKVTTTAEKLNMTIRVSTTSKESNPLDDKTVVRMRAIIEADILVRGVSTPEQVMFSGEVAGESVMTTEEDVGLEVIHTYEVENLKGSGRVNASTLRISWPYAQQDNQYLLYLIEPPQVKAEVPVVCEYNPEIINPLKLELRPSTSFSTAALTRPSKQSANLRSAVAETGPVRPRREKRESGIFNNPHRNFDCDSPNSAKCHEIKCKIGELGEGDYVVIQLRARVWNSTFLRGYVDFDRVTVSSKAEIEVDPRLNVRQPTGNDIGRATTTIVPDIQVQRPHGLAPWIIILIIIVAIIIGIFLLCLIMLLLWKCGFFKRNKPSDELATQKAKLERQSEYNDDY